MRTVIGTCFRCGRYGEMLHAGPDVLTRKSLLICADNKCADDPNPFDEGGDGLAEGGKLSDSANAGARGTGTRPGASSLISQIEERIVRAETRYGEFASTHEAMGVALEEWDELREAIRSRDTTRVAGAYSNL